MPGRKKKKFIDKKHAVTFSLVHRSQRDPLQADEDAPQHVLLSTEVPKQEGTKLRVEEQQKYGIFFEDDYDYTQHLRDVNELYDVGPGESVRIQGKLSKSETAGLQLPSSVFGSTVETEIGLLNKAAPESGPRIDWDPDIVAALDDDFDFDNPDNQLDDNFMSAAQAEGDGLSDDSWHSADTDLKVRGGQATLDFVKSQRVHFEGDLPEGGDGDVASDEADRSDVGSDFGRCEGSDGFVEEETRSHFTSYSMSSSVIRRNQGLTLVDDRFEKIYEQYDEEEIGALDHEEISGHIPADSILLSSVLDDFEKTQAKPKLKDVEPGEGDVNINESDSEEEEMVTVEMDEKPKEKWDCESILSTYSTLYNHPHTIQEPKKIKPITLTRRVQIPAGMLPERGLTLRQLEEQDSPRAVDQAPTYRPRDETPEERRARKEAVRQERKDRREQKKATKTAFKEEKKRQEKEIQGIRNNLQGVHIS